MKKKLLIAGSILGCALGLAAFEKHSYERRSAALENLPKGATKEQVLAIFGKPDSGADGDDWHYETVLPSIFYIWRSPDKWDDMVLEFDDGKMNSSCMCPE